MKKITFMRHAKSSWDEPVGDRQRPLTTRGYKDAVMMGIALREHLRNLKMIYSSPAKRAFDTSVLVADKIGFPKGEIKIVEDLYDFHGDLVKAFLKQLPDEVEYIMLFGHNNAFTNLVDFFLDENLGHLPTSGTVTIGFESVSWSKLSTGKLLHILIPKSLKS